MQDITLNQSNYKISFDIPFISGSVRIAQE